ncbi:MAG: hypothetical protein GY754_06600 [bacterium]|nr:hypothetical protein [bacterium]
MNKKHFAVVVTALAVVVTLGVTEVFSQGRGRGNRGRGHGNCAYGNRGGGMMRLKMMEKKLNLSKEQVERIFKIKTEYREKCFNNRDNAEKVRELRKEQRKAVEEVLTKEQKEQFNRFRRFKRGSGRKGDCPYR